MKAFSFGKENPNAASYRKVAYWNGKRKPRSNIITRGGEVRRRNQGFSSKGQHQALSVILISGILIGVVGSVYFWGVPLIQKNRDIATQQNSEVFMKNLAERAKFVANHGGRERLFINVPGFVEFDPVLKALDLTIETQGTLYETETWIQLGRNGCTITSGSWGIDDPETLCVKSIQAGETYITTYRLSFIQLNTGTLTSHRIDMTGIETSGGEGHAITIENTGTQTVSEDSRNVVVTQLATKVELG